jgi:hypothetical protein
VDDPRELKKVLAALVRAAIPELIQIATPIRARVVRVHEEGGKEQDESPIYCIDVQPLAPDGSDDPNWPELPWIDLPVLWAGPDVGVYCPPDEGSVVRIAFEYGDRSRPFILGLAGLGADVPAHPRGTLLIRAGDALVRVRRDAGGDVSIEAANVRVKGTTQVVVEGPVVHLAGTEGDAVVRRQDLLTVLNALVLPVSNAVPAAPGVVTAGPVTPALTALQVEASSKVNAE